MAEMTDIKAIMTYFKSDIKPIDLQEMKALSPEDRKELGQLCREELELGQLCREELKQK